jgi:hypothetical protein
VLIDGLGEGLFDGLSEGLAEGVSEGLGEAIFDGSLLTVGVKVDDEGDADGAVEGAHTPPLSTLVPILPGLFWNMLDVSFPEVSQHKTRLNATALPNMNSRDVTELRSQGERSRLKT